MIFVFTYLAARLCTISSYACYFKLNNLEEKFFYPRTIREWNPLPANVATAGSLGTFKVLISQLE
jgi:hypothetical protein